MFEQLLGNDALKARLTASLSQNRPSHCYLLAGPTGSGKTTLARLLAAALVCEGAHPPCMTCRACRKVLDGIHPDVITVDSPDRKSVPVERVRALQADAYIRPNEGRRKVYILPRAQDLTESAQNALLKLIEEPPAYAVFLLLADSPEKLLPTVQSRCQLLRLCPLPQATALSELARRYPQSDPGALRAAYRRSGGYLGAAAALLEADALAPETCKLVEALSGANPMALVTLLASLERRTREELKVLFLQWRELLARALMARSGLEEGAEAARLAQRLSGPALARCLAAVEQALDAADANAGTGHLCGALAARLSDALWQS